MILIVLCVVGLTEIELQSLVSLARLLNGSKVNVDDLQNVGISPEDLLPSLLMLQLVRALRCFLRPSPTAR